MLLMVLATGDRLADDEYELRLLLDADEDERRNEVRRPPGVKRAVMAWKRDVCIVAVVAVAAEVVGELNRGDDGEAVEEEEAQPR